MAWNGTHTQYSGDATNETVTGTANPEAEWGYGGDDNLTGGDGDDYLDGGWGSDQVFGGDGNDIVTDWGGDSGTGLVGHDQLYAGKGDDEIRVYSPDTGDIVDGGQGIDLIRLDFHSASDIQPVSLVMGPTTVAKLAGVDTVAISNVEKLIFYGGAGGDTVVGGDYDDAILGAGGDDHLEGGGGNDQLDSGKGHVYLDGGANDDRGSFDLSDAVDNITIASGATINLGSHGVVKNIENLDDVLTGSGADTFNINQTLGIGIESGAGADNITVGGAGGSVYAGADGDTVTMSAIADYVNPGTGDDVVHLGAGDDQLDYTVGFSNSRTGSGNDTVYGEDGNDEIYTGDGADHLEGGNGNDFIFAGLNGDSAYGGDGNDTIHGEGGADFLYGGAGNDNIDSDYDYWTDTYPVDNDTLEGGDGNDTLAGGFGLDTINGGIGDDTLSLSNRFPVVVGGGAGVESFDQNIDQLNGGAGIDTFSFFPFNYSDTLSVTLKIAPTMNVKIDGVTLANVKNVEALNVFLYGQGNHNITGGAYADRVTTEFGDDTIVTGAGNDTIDASSGNDTVDAGEGSDQVTVKIAGTDNVQMGKGDDTMYLYNWYTGYDLPQDSGVATYDGGDGFDVLNINLASGVVTDVTFDGSKLKSGGVTLANISHFEVVNYSGGNDGFTFKGSPGNDKVTGGTGNDAITLLGGDDTATGVGGDDNINGGAGNDTLDGGVGANTVNGGADNDTIKLTLDALVDTIDGGTGTDTLQVLNPSNLTPIVMTGDLATGATITAGGSLAANVQGIETISIFGAAGNDALIGGGGNDNLSAAGGTDTVNAGDGDDFVSGTIDSGADTFDLGAGSHDFLSLGNVAAGDIVMSGTFANLAIKVSGVKMETVKGIERISISGGNGNDSLFGASLNDSLYGGAGANTLDGKSGDDSLGVTADAVLDNVDGGLGTDSLQFSAFGQPAIVMMANGATGMNVSAGGSTIIHAVNIETLFAQGSSFDDTLLGLGGNDSLICNDGNDTADGGAGNDFVYGGNGVDKLTGGFGDDALQGGVGVDKLDGGKGADTAQFNDQSLAVVVKLNGTHSVTAKIGGIADDKLTGIENLTGGQGADQLTGDKNANVLHGSNGDDALSGGAGNDTLYGEFGHDALTGGAGHDKFVFNTTISFTNTDTIADFDVANDTIGLGLFPFSTLIAGPLAASQFVVGTAAVDADDRIIYDSATGALYYDSDGMGGLVQAQFATLDPGLALTAANFVVG